jgi:hypothetical protein
MELNQFNPPTLDDIKERFFKGEDLTEEDIATILGLLEAKNERLKAICKLSQQND